MQFTLIGLLLVMTIHDSLHDRHRVNEFLTVCFVSRVFISMGYGACLGVDAPSLSCIVDIYLHVKREVCVYMCLFHARGIQLARLCICSNKPLFVLSCWIGAQGDAWGRIQV